MLSVPQILQITFMMDRTGTLEKALERNLLNVEHEFRLPLLNLSQSEILCYPYHFNKTRIPRRWKCSRLVCSIQMGGLFRRGGNHD